MKAKNSGIRISFSWNTTGNVIPAVPNRVDGNSLFNDYTGGSIYSVLDRWPSLTTNCRSNLGARRAS